MTDRKEPEGPAGEDEIYVIDDTGDLDEVQELAGYRDAPVPVEEIASSTGGGAVSPDGDPGGVDALRTESQKLKDQLLRSRAEFENFRKRAEREKSEYFRYALSEALRELISVLDNFERAISIEYGPVEDFRQGVEMIHKQLSEMLTRNGLETLDPLGQPFDPTYHEAIARDENSDAEPNTVTEVLQKGYVLHDRLLRPALVKVAAGRAPASQDESSS